MIQKTIHHGVHRGHVSKKRLHKIEKRMKKRVVRIAKRETKKAQIKAEANGIKPAKAEKMSKTAGKAAVRVATTIVE
jgi:hypothetical protein